jgi:hypothetical protein
LCPGWIDPSFGWLLVSAGGFTWSASRTDRDPIF